MKKLLLFLFFYQTLFAMPDLLGKENVKQKEMFEYISCVLKEANVIIEYKEFRNNIYSIVLEINELGLSNDELSGIRSDYVRLQCKADSMITRILSGLAFKKTRIKLISVPSGILDFLQEIESGEFSALEEDFKNNFCHKYANLKGANVFSGLKEMEVCCRQQGLIFCPPPNAKNCEISVFDKMKKSLLLKEWGNIAAKDVVN